MKRLFLPLVLLTLYSCGNAVYIPPVKGYPPEVWNLIITSDFDEYGSPILIFSFNYYDEDGDVGGGYIGWKLNSIEMENIPIEGEQPNEGKLEVTYTRGLIKGAEYRLDVRLFDLAGNKSNILTDYYTIPEG